MALYLAVDAGGTRTTFLLADEHRELARAVSGTIKRMRADLATVTRHFEQASTELEERSGRKLLEVATTCIGAAGSTVPLVFDWLHQAFAARVGGRLLLLGDVEIALDAAFSGKPGVLALAGTGSNVAGRLGSGEIITAGGWGPALSDQGSGHAIGRAGLRAAVLERDERGSSTLLDAILDFWQLGGFQELVAFSNADPPPDLSRLAPLIAARGAAGDPVAARVLETEAGELAHLARILLGRVRQSTDGHGPLRLAFAGSVLENIPSLRHAIITTLERDLGPLDVTPGVVEPIVGALWRARTLS